MTASPDEFTTLEARVRLGDEEALAELLRQYEPEVRRAARYLLGRLMRSGLDSVDLVQSVYVALLEGLRDKRFYLSNAQQFLGLANKIVRGKVARHWRKARHQFPLDAEALETGAVGAGATAASGGETDPAAQVEYNDALEHLFAYLNEPEREVVELRLLGCSTAEVARRLGLDPDVLRVRLSRLRRRLREEKALIEWL
jgi:RNA polymerase sigma factor (sigma-70 family)